MVMVDASWMDTPSGALPWTTMSPSPHQRSRRRPKLIMRPTTSAAFSAAFAFASAAFAFREQNFTASRAAPRCAVRYPLTGLRAAKRLLLLWCRAPHPCLPLPHTHHTRPLIECQPHPRPRARFSRAHAAPRLDSSRVRAALARSVLAVAVMVPSTVDLELARVFGWLAYALFICPIKIDAGNSRMPHEGGSTCNLRCDVIVIDTAPILSHPPCSRKTQRAAARSPSRGRESKIDGADDRSTYF